MPDNRRPTYGPVPVAALLPRLTRAAFRRHGTALTAVAADWEAIVGPALAAVTVPRRLGAGTLTLGCAGPIALELQHMAQSLIARVNLHLGGEPVQRLRFVQIAQAVLPPGPPPKPPVTPEAASRLAAKLADLPPELQAALASLGTTMLRTR
ncbi:MAG TPA: DUF721 domain-containing protein [Acetobacteraceae bacterium]|nr:DUF721 domain-containing protein [Acetobacteraceae bacterium]